MRLISRKDAKVAGVKLFFTGEPCIRGHIAERFVSNGSCYDCLKAKIKDWRAENPDRCREHGRRSAKKNAAKAAERKLRWKSANRARHLARSREYTAANKERISEQKKRIYARKRDQYLARMAAFREANKSRLKARRDQKKAENPEVFRAWDRAKHAKRRAAPGKHTAADITDIMKMQNGRCAYCRIKLGSKYHVDHIKALSRGGSNCRRNLQILCQPCNSKKHALDPIVFARKQGLLL